MELPRLAESSTGEDTALWDDAVAAHLSNPSGCLPQPACDVRRADRSVVVGWVERIGKPVIVGGLGNNRLRTCLFDLVDHLASRRVSGPLDHDQLNCLRLVNRAS